jgi:hypothetical protein
MQPVPNSLFTGYACKGQVIVSACRCCVALFGANLVVLLDEAGADQ